MNKRSNDTNVQINRYTGSTRDGKLQRWDNFIKQAADKVLVVWRPAITPKKE